MENCFLETEAPECLTVRDPGAHPFAAFPIGPSPMVWEPGEADGYCLGCQPTDLEYLPVSTAGYRM